MIPSATILDFFYDASGTPIAMRQSAVGSTNYTIYYYITNLQGDVIRLVDINGNTAAYYEYDPYGNAVTASGSHANINPLRYRGYYYDSETELYYLQSRYYDPQVGRFINADALVSTGQGLLGNNMFAYCLNNPIFKTDDFGYFAVDYYDDSEDRLNIFNDVGQAGGAAAIVTLGIVGYSVYSSNQSKRKPVNLPSKKKVTPDMKHISSGHMPDGSRNPDGKKTVFWGLAANEVAKAIIEAYSTASKLQTQGSRIKLIGYSDTYNLVIEMWVNIVTFIIETAYPVESQ